jgi:membrane protein YdbS with pleckstrin-like domain
MRKAIVKEGPLVFIRNFLVMELVATVILYAASFLENYEQIYQGSIFGKAINYDTFLMIIFSLFQFVYITLLFLDWYFSLYEVGEKEIVKRSGLLFRHRKSVSLFDVTSVELYQSPLSRMMFHGTIILEHKSGRVTKLRNVGNFEEYLHIIKQTVQGASGHLRTKDITMLLEHGEGLFVELKETLRYDVRKGEVSKEMEKMVLKSIVGFLNAEGGTLLIGVSDGGVVVGLDNDYKNLPKKNRDGLENHLSMLIKTSIGLTFAKYVGVAFEAIEGKDVCMVTVTESHKPAYLRNGDRTEEFFVRVGNSTQPFSMSDAEDYIKTHWK